MSEEMKSSPSPHIPWYYSRLLIFAGMFLVAGALVLPLLWLSPAFSRRGKVFWSIVAVVYTGLLIWASVWMVQFDIELLQNLLQS